MARVPPNSIWAQMNYTPPRGGCNHKNSLISGTCPCLRFMLHPLKSATSFDCDGCGHHASFHDMENEKDEKTIIKWSEEGESSRQPAAKKRKARAITNGGPADAYEDSAAEGEDYVRRAERTILARLLQ